MDDVRALVQHLVQENAQQADQIKKVGQSLAVFGKKLIEFQKRLQLLEIKVKREETNEKK